MDRKIGQIIEDLKLIQTIYREFINIESKVFLANAMHFEYPTNVDMVITSPPYMNGMDYVINYKIEMAWLGFTDQQRTLKSLKNQMVVCDNVSKGLIKEFVKTERYTNEWIENIKREIRNNIQKRGSYRRMDMPEIVHKYFDDMYKVMSNVYKVMNRKARFVLVIGDSLIADVYVPTDLLIAKIGQDLGLRVESIEKARERRSGQIRSYRLRESVVTLIKE